MDHIPFGYYYGRGEMNGTFVKDLVTLGGIEVHHQQFALVNKVSKSLIRSDYNRHEKYNTSTSVQGVLGLGFSDRVQVPINATKYDPLLTSMGNQVFSIYTNMNKGWSGEMTLGGVNTDRFTGNIAYAAISPISTDGNDTTPATYSMWTVQAQSLGVSDTTNSQQTKLLILPFKQEKYVMIDTGTTLSYVGGLYASQLVIAVTQDISPRLDKDTGCYFVNCELRNSTKMIDLVLSQYTNGTAGTVQLGIPVKELILSFGENDQCIFSICGWPDTDDKNKIPAFIFGNSIIQTLYLVFDSFNLKIGFASPLHSITIVS